MSNSSKKIEPIASQKAIEYAKNNIAPRVLELNEFGSKAQSLAKIISYHVLEMCFIASGEKISHKQIEKTIGLEYSSKISSMGRKVADFVLNKKLHRGEVLTIDMFRETVTVNAEGGQIIVPPLYHVSTIAGQIGHDNAKRNAAKKDTKSVVEQALAAAGVPIESAERQMKLAEEGNEVAMQFVKSASEKFTPIKAEKAGASETVTITQEEALSLALDALMDMATSGESDKAVAWLTAASELITPAAVDAPVQEAVAA